MSFTVCEDGAGCIIPTSIEENHRHWGCSKPLDDAQPPASKSKMFAFASPATWHEPHPVHLYFHRVGRLTIPLATTCYIVVHPAFFSVILTVTDGIKIIVLSAKPLITNQGLYLRAP